MNKIIVGIAGASERSLIKAFNFAVKKISENRETVLESNLTKVSFKIETDKSTYSFLDLSKVDRGRRFNIIYKVDNISPRQQWECLLMLVPKFNSDLKVWDRNSYIFSVC